MSWDNFISFIFLIIGCLLLTTFNLSETKEAIKKYNILLNKDDVSCISSITIDKYQVPRSETIKKKILIKNRSDINSLFSELNKIKSSNPNVSLAKTVKLIITLDNNEIIDLSISKTTKNSDFEGYLIKLLVNNNNCGKYESEKIWEILYKITGDNFFEETIGNGSK